MKKIAALAGALLMTSGAAFAQTAAPEDVEAVTVEELVVRGRLPGPAWWRVSDADSTVYVLGLPDALPKGMAWDQTILNRRLKGAKALLTPPVYQVSVNVFAAPGLLLGVRNASKSRTALNESLPPELQGRLARAAVAAGKSAADYQSMRPWFAGVRLADAYHKHAGLDYAQPLRSVTGAAKRAKVKSRPAYIVGDKARDVLGQVKEISDETGRTCVGAAVGEVEAGQTAIRTAASAWAAGDPRVALGAPRGSDICYAALPGARKSKLDSLERQAEAIAAELATPGHSVAALSLRSLVAKDGVLQRLQGRGYKVATPD